MRTSRMLAVLLELGNGRPTTVQALADRHRVAPRTIQRDLASLQRIGVPVWTRTGPAGGVGLIDGWRSPVTGMTATELQTLVLGEAGSRDLGLHEDFTAARLKMLSAGSMIGAAPARTHDRFLLDNEAWFATPDRPEALTDVARSVWDGRRLSFDYVSRPHRKEPAPGPPPDDPPRPRRRTVDPLGLVLKTDRWYLVGARDGVPRTYRLSRMSEVQVHAEVAERPVDFSLAAYWRESRAAFEQAIAPLPVRLSVPLESVEALARAVPGDSTRTAIDGARHSGERVEIRLRMESVEIAVAQLMAVPSIEVHEPAQLRRLMHDRATSLAARNEPGTSAAGAGSGDDTGDGTT